MRDDELPLLSLGYLILISGVKHPIEMGLILVVNVESVSMGQDRVAHVLLSRDEELRCAVFARSFQVILFAGRGAGGRDEEVFSRLGLTDTAGVASIKLLVDQFASYIVNTSSVDLTGAEGII